MRDDGKGISGDVAEFRSDSIGIGIGGMMQRVKEFGGELRLRNTHPGTEVEVSIPIQSSAAAEPLPQVGAPGPVDIGGFKANQQQLTIDRS